MFVGRVVGTVWSTVKWPEVEGLKLLAVQPYHLDDLAGDQRPASRSSDLVICADTLDAGVGDEVVVAYGHAARVAICPPTTPDGKPSVPVDAAIVAIIDGIDVDAAALAAARAVSEDQV
ncbi:MAG: EutN/CcmL family microcompartment protein [Myxococcales bacterium]|nr:EutN/CcmL family microcompartment protein [Myxococcales bacterium]